MNLFGKFRGVVEAFDDPQKRLRCRVRVAGVHDGGIPIEHLPWAELVLPFSAPGAGDFHHFERGDRVWVEFEGGKIEYPLIVGGWVAKRRGLDDIPADKVSEYARGIRRWTRQDRAGNLIEMSENGDELHVKLKSGRATIRISQVDDSIEIETPSAVSVKAGQVTAQAQQAFLECGDIVASANGREGGGPAGKLTLMSNMDVDILVRDVPHGGHPDGAINIGQRLNDGGITDVDGSPHQSPRVNLYATEVHVGSRDSIPYLPTTKVVIKAADEVQIDATAEVNIASAGEVNVSAAQVTVEADVKIDLIAPQINVGV